ncbi:MAG: DHH family phosphoesterase [Planctomycetaceae bacterium]|jgi:phosphoesterase RecJ-like protein|nr:DHH family phosphoesterase [Planctomycetaceae bacterium]
MELNESSECANHGLSDDSHDNSRNNSHESANGNKIDWSRFTAIVGKSTRVLLTAHKRPDGDCLGSEIAMHHILNRLGKDVRILNHHPVPYSLLFLDKSRWVRCFGDLDDEMRQWLSGVDLVMILDTSVWSQLGDVAQIVREMSAKKLVLDHHETWEELGAERFVDSAAEATGVVVVRAAAALGVELDRAIAEPLFTAIATDTGWFAYSSVTAETYRVVAKLIDAGVVASDIYKEIYEQESIERIRLIGRTLANVETFFDGDLMLAKITLADLAAVGGEQSDSEGLASMILKVKDSKISVLISELDDGSFKISLRSRSNIDCSKLASQFGGGGHKKAAGATLHLTYEETKNNIINAISKTLEASEK